MRRISNTARELQALRAKLRRIAEEQGLDLGPIPNDLPLESTPRYKRMLEEAES